MFEKQLIQFHRTALSNWSLVFKPFKNRKIFLLSLLLFCLGIIAYVSPEIGDILSVVYTTSDIILSFGAFYMFIASSAKLNVFNSYELNMEAKSGKFLEIYF
mgnify:CR=1 FL=1